jgi:hypothetical protein
MIRTLPFLVLPLAAAEVARQPVIPPPPAVQTVDEARITGRVTPSPWFGAVWEDGLAEVAEYDLTQFRYGNLHPGTATLITVRETMDPQRGVKSRDGAGVPVLKCHWVRSFQTGVYRYDQSSFQLVRRSDGIPLRWFITSHEWCGAAAKSWLNGGDLEVRSYFDGHGDLRQPLALGADTVPADSLWWWARAVAASGATTAAIRVVPSQIEARTVDTTPVAAVATVSAAGDRWRVEVRRADGSADALELDRAAPHVVRRWRQSDGSTMVLRTVRRFDYWAHHDPADRP